MTISIFVTEHNQGQHHTKMRTAIASAWNQMFPNTTLENRLDGMSAADALAPLSRCISTLANEPSRFYAVLPCTKAYSELMAQMTTIMEVCACNPKAVIDIWGTE